ncbi:anaerobic ribonucleoside-triphosphate reductase activating protein [Candidatus Pacearchaeota archaeon]|nr:anaerobic ribonucleoside-triphosphate reductase activating protein [Candidatus Pacearchaeota archaeon]
MKIAGLQKVSTIDYPGEICCVIFLWGCNFRCGFCYNSGLVVSESKIEFSSEEVLSFLKKRIGKLDAVCISGGEPLMSLDFDFVRRIKEMGFKIKIDTNGSFPERLLELVSEGLVDYIAMDVKGAREDYYKIVNMEIDLGNIERSIKIVDDFGRGNISPRICVNGREFNGKENNPRTSTDEHRQGCSEFRTTVVPGLHDGEKLIKMGEWMGGVCGEKPSKIFLQGFKHGESMIDISFMEKDEVLEGELIRLKKLLSELFGEICVRV